MELAKINSDYYCGVDLHDKNMFNCIMEKDGKILYHKRIRNNPEDFKRIITKYKGSISIGVESTHNYYWLYDLCKKEGIPFYLGHAYYLRAIRGKKKKDDKIDSKTLADLMRTNFFAIGYPYPKARRGIRDLLRRRTKLVQQRAGVYNHIHLVYSQQGEENVNLSELKNKTERINMLEKFDDPGINYTIEIDLDYIDYLDGLINKLEKRIKEKAGLEEKETIELLKSYPGIGDILSLTILYEIDTIDRFPTVQKFSSYSRVVKTQRESNKKRTDNKNQKIGNPYLKWAFSQASVMAIKYSPEIKKYFERLKKRMPKQKAMAVLRHRLAIAVYKTLKNKEPFNLDKFLQTSK